ncbi:MAG: hypothetical protein V1676_04515 [Candidatus Diapherotrites archaeon]
MKGNEAEYVISLVPVFSQPRTKRAKKAVKEVKRFVKKHARSDNAVITEELNREIWKNSKNIQRRLEVMLVKKDGKVYVYLSKGKQLAEDRKREADDKKKKEAEKKEKEKKAAEGKDGKKEAKDIEAEEAEKKKREEKREKEIAAEKGDIKRGMK